MYGLSAKIMAVAERWPLVEVRLYSVTGAWEKELRKKKNRLMPFFSVSSEYSPIYRKSPQTVSIPARRKKKIMLLLNRAFPPSCGQMHQLEAKVDTIR